MALVGAASTCVGSAVTSPICQGVDSIGSALFGTGATAALDAMSSWVGSGAAWLIGQAGSALATSSAVDLTSPWFLSRYHAALAMVAPLALPLLVAAAIHALFRQSPGLLLRAVVIQLPLGMVLAGAAIELATLAIGITDQLCRSISAGTGGSVQSLTTSLAGAVLNSGGTSGVGAPAFIVLLGAVVAALAALMLWIELLLRSAAIYVAVAFLPLVLVTMVWPALSSWSRRLVETLVGLIVAKVVIVMALDMAVGAMGTAAGRGFSTVVAGIALLLLAAFAPFSLLKLLPLFEASAAGHLEGLRQRGMASVTHGAPRRAVDLALSAAQASIPTALPAALAMAGAPRDLASTGADPEGVGVQATEDPLAGSAMHTASGDRPEPPIIHPDDGPRTPTGPSRPSRSAPPRPSQWTSSDAGLSRSAEAGTSTPLPPSPGPPPAPRGRPLDGEPTAFEPPVVWPVDPVDPVDPAAERGHQPVTGVRADVTGRRTPGPTSLRIETDAIGPRIVMADRLDRTATSEGDDVER